MTVVDQRQQAALIRWRVLKLWLAAAPVALAHAACQFELVSTPRALGLWLELGYAHWVLAGVLIALLGLGRAAFRASALLREREVLQKKTRLRLKMPQLYLTKQRKYPDRYRSLQVATGCYRLLSANIPSTVG